MDIRPLRDRLVVRRLEGEEAIGGIIIPDSAREKPQRGRVVAAGAGRVTEAGAIVPLEVRAGDEILFGKYASPEITLDGEEFLIMREDEVLALIGNGATTKTKKA